MTCDETRKILHEYVDGELDGAAAAAVKGHIAGCAACRKEAAELEALGRALAAVKPLRAPALAVERTKGLVRAEAARAQRRQVWARGALVAAAALVLITVSVLQLSGAIPHLGKPIIDANAAKAKISSVASGAIATVTEKARPYTSNLPEPMLLLKLAGIAAAVLVAVVATTEELVARQLQRRFHF